MGTPGRPGTTSRGPAPGRAWPLRPRAWGLRFRSSARVPAIVRAAIHPGGAAGCGQSAAPAVTGSFCRRARGRVSVAGYGKAALIPAIQVPNAEYAGAALLRGPAAEVRRPARPRPPALCPRRTGPCPLLAQSSGRPLTRKTRTLFRCLEHAEHLARCVGGPQGGLAVLPERHLGERAGQRQQPGAAPRRTAADPCNENLGINSGGPPPRPPSSGATRGGLSSTSRVGRLGSGWS
jgi:hypothetical protein